MNGSDFVKRENVDFNGIKYKNKWREKERLQKLKINEQRKLDREIKRKRLMEKEEKERYNKKEDMEGFQRKKKQRKKKVGNKKRKSGFDVNGKPEEKKRRLSHKLREFKHYQKEEALLRQLKKNHITQEEFDEQMGYQL